MIDSIVGLEKYQKSKAKTICLGTFDGFHKGHQKLAEHSDFMITFDPHPKSIIQTKSSIDRLTFPNELKYFVPNLLIIPFTKQVSQMNANQFLVEFIEPLQPSKITIGYDFKFGKNGDGNFNVLNDWGKKHHCEIIQINLQMHHDKTPYKSSIIRKELTNNPNYAFELLGHPYLISGHVIEGDKRGHKIGFPTANIMSQKNKCIPKFGVYQSQAIVNEKTYNSITYIGKKPTFKSKEPSIETHILDGFSKTIYGTEINVLISKFIRDDIRFENKNALITQIRKDIQSIKN